MRKLLLAAACTLALPVSALAADLPVKAPPMAAPLATLSWTGCYIGGNGGGAWSSMDTHVTIFNSGATPYDGGKTSLDGWAAGGQVGCDYQINNAWVIGARGMWDASDSNGKNHQPGNVATLQNYKIEGFATAVATLGYLPAPNLQIYGLGGVAWVRDNLDWSQSGIGTFAESTHTRTGYDVGVGIAWMFAPHWNLFVEYDHMGFGTKNQNLTGTGAGAAFAYAADVKQNVDKVLVGLNLRFDGSGSASFAAKY